MSNVKISNDNPAKKSLNGDFVIFNGATKSQIGIVYPEDGFNGSATKRVAWSEGSTTTYDSTIHLPFVGTLTIS